jgi:hypothetical protein
MSPNSIWNRRAAQSRHQVSNLPRRAVHNYVTAQDAARPKMETSD